MTRFEVTTINKTLIITLDKNLAKILFEQRKEQYNYLELKKVTITDTCYRSESIEIATK
jgi:hypothetical protein